VTRARDGRLRYCGSSLGRSKRYSIVHSVQACSVTYRSPVRNVPMPFAGSKVASTSHWLPEAGAEVKWVELYLHSPTLLYRTHGDGCKFYDELLIEREVDLLQSWLLGVGSLPAVLAYATNNSCYILQPFHSIDRSQPIKTKINLNFSLKMKLVPRSKHSPFRL
jgi:hypothetical protein